MEYYKTILKETSGRKTNTWCRYTKRIDTYGMGCEHACKYCYANSLLEFRGMWKSKPKPIILKELRSVVSALSKKDVIRIGGMTDCFQPIEREMGLTYELIKLLNYYRIDYLILTKSSLVATDKYLNIYDPLLAHFQISITNTNNKDLERYENASPISERIKAVEILNAYGFDVAIRLSPFIEGFIDYDILSRIECDKILIEFLKASPYIKSHFDIDYSKYTLYRGNYYNLQLDEKLRLLSYITGFRQMSVGEYVQEHHEYFIDNFNYNKSDCCNLNIKRKFMNTNQQTLF